jgi:hypothetical protein
MRQVIDGTGREWQVAEVGAFGFGATRRTTPNIGWVHFTLGDRTLKLEAPKGWMESAPDTELAKTLDWLLAKDEVSHGNKQMREITDTHGTSWLVTEEGLPGEHRGIPGGLALRFISPTGTRYLTPSPAFWQSVADDYLLSYLEAAHPVREDE